MRHRRPIAQRGRQQHAILPAAANQLLHRLRAVEKPSRRIRNYKQISMHVSSNHIPFVVHRGIKG